MQEAIIAIVGLIIGALLVAGAMAAGYWAGRNSAERPFRSKENQKEAITPNRKAQLEPEGGDFYQDAAFGEDTGPVSTIPRQ